MHRFEGTEIKILVFSTGGFLEKEVFTTFLTVNFFGKSIISELWIIDVVTGVRKNEFIHNERGESLRSKLNTEKKKRTIYSFIFIYLL